MNSRPIVVTAAEGETGGHTMAKQNRLLVTKTVRLNEEGLNIRYAELGDRAHPTVLLLHGVPENLHGWYAVAPLLAERYHVLAFDWPGFGGSDPLTSPEDYTSRRFAEVIVDFMDSLHIAQAVLLATDIALLPSLLVGLDHPRRVSKLAVMDGIPFPRPKYSSWELKSFAKKGSILGKAMRFCRTSKTSAWAKSTLSRTHTSFKHPCWWCGASTIASSAASWGLRLRKSCQTPS